MPPDVKEPAAPVEMEESDMIDVVPAEKSQETDKAPADLPAVAQPAQPMVVSLDDMYAAASQAFQNKRAAKQVAVDGVSAARKAKADSRAMRVAAESEVARLKGVELEHDAMEADALVLVDDAEMESLAAAGTLHGILGQYLGV